MKFPDRAVVVALHDFQLAHYGGLAGIRDENLLESALVRPQNKHAYGEEDIHVLAASLAYGIARNHPFLDGNKRTALHTALLMLSLNGAAVPPPSAQMVEIMVLLAAGEITEDQFANWLHEQAQAKP